MADMRRDLSAFHVSEARPRGAERCFKGLAKLAQLNIELAPSTNEKRENSNAHVVDFVEVTIPRYSTYQFKSHFRMFPEAFDRSFVNSEARPRGAERCFKGLAKLAQLNIELAPSTNEKRENSNAHVVDFVEVTIPRYSTYQFKSHFRMFPEAFDVLQAWIEPHLPQERGFSNRTKLLATLWLLANKETFRSVADRFAMNKGSLHRCVMMICRTLVANQGEVIQWPERDALEKLAEKWQQKAGMPGVVGALDGTYIPILGTSGPRRESYICRKGFPAMHLQVVCDSSLKFLYVQTGNVGSVHDSHAFRTCDLYHHLESPEGRLPHQFHLLGDSAYPLREFLMVPFRDNGHLSPLEILYNKVHSSTRVEVERSIGLLKGKFRRLKQLDMYCFDEIPYVITAACVLHNFILRQSGVDEDDIDMNDEDGGNQVGPLDGVNIGAGNAKRYEIANILMNQ